MEVSISVINQMKIINTREAFLPRTNTNSVYKHSSEDTIQSDKPLDGHL